MGHRKIGGDYDRDANERKNAADLWQLGYAISDRRTAGPTARLIDWLAAC
jgi:hypothetical protein